jgi:hypothetical protein
VSQDDEFFALDAELVEKLCAGDANENLRQLFMARTKRWKHPFIHAECYTFGIFGDLEQKLEPPTAFSLIPQAVEMVVEQKDPELLATAFSLLCGVSRATNTTEMPSCLETNWGKLRLLSDQIPKHGLVYWESLREWYRK